MDALEVNPGLNGGIMYPSGGAGNGRWWEGGLKIVNSCSHWVTDIISTDFGCRMPPVKIQYFWIIFNSHEMDPCIANRVEQIDPKSICNPFHEGPMIFGQIYISKPLQGQGQGGHLTARRRPSFLFQPAIVSHTDWAHNSPWIDENRLTGLGGGRRAGLCYLIGASPPNKLRTGLSEGCRNWTQQNAMTQKHNPLSGLQILSLWTLPQEGYSEN